MKLNIFCDAIFRLYQYSIYTKLIHYTTESKQMHELCDSVFWNLQRTADDLAESYFGFAGKPAMSDMEHAPEIQKEDNLDAICQDVINLLIPLKKEFEKEEKLAGSVSRIDELMDSMNKYKFLATFDRNVG